MKTIKEPAREIPVKYETDVLVIGGGPAGFAAAVSCGRQGLKTLLIEKTGTIGGVATSGLMSHWTGNTEGPLYEELLNRASTASKDVNYFDDKVLKAEQIIDPENTKLVMLKMLIEAGVTLRLYSFAADVLMDGNRVTGAILENKSGRSAALAKIIIDCSGDGDIAAKAGVDFHMGRESDGMMQPVTIMFKVAGVNEETAVYPGEFEDDFDVPAGKLQQLGRLHLKEPIGHVLIYPGSVPGVATVNMTNSQGIDGTKSSDLTRAEVECRSQIPEIITFLKRFVPGYENCYLIATSSVIGVRETRHFKGLYTITEEDIEEAKVFDDWIVTRAFFNFDIHGMSGPGLDPSGAQKSFRQTEKYSIPLGCFIPEKVDGLFLAGRNISGTHKAHSNYRVMPICVNMGQGVAAAASVCLKNGHQPRELDYKDVQTILKEQGVHP
ncbi:FAD-dependent oxidoreductase [Oceanispirochaeta sp.]|uniref:FAD-dependent oxidoreductase n=1 Tax=Oceanispirochaeta sp. TaxID=2035350 RepID=UPI0026078A0F|nr:FAD-dependent oxidoreductase [Oceanispirochaeta sp.]MDA3959104.1 FAD-dependent oxidoreductase [Oceanispirochaeta sp.]